MLELISKMTLIIVFAVLLGIIIGYFLSRPHQESEEEEGSLLNEDLHVDSHTGIVSDATFNKR